MDWSDDVAYSVHDVEDGIHGGYVDLDPLRHDADERAALCADVAAVYSGETADDLAAVLDRAARRPGARAAVRLRRQPPRAGRAQAGDQRAHRPVRRGDDHRDPGPVRPGRRPAGTAPTWWCRGGIRAQVALLKGIALRYVMRRPEAEPSYARQQEMLHDLVAALVDRAPDVLDPVFAPLWRAAPDDAARLRVIIDQVASLTDPAAVAWHRRLCTARGDGQAGTAGLRAHDRA